MDVPGADMLPRMLPLSGSSRCNWLLPNVLIHISFPFQTTPSGERLGAGMLRGTIVAFQEPELLPTYLYGCGYQPVFLKLMLRELQSYGMPVTDEHLSGVYRRYSGDLNRLGKGEILVYDQR